VQPRDEPPPEPVPTRPRRNTASRRGWRLLAGATAVLVLAVAALGVTVRWHRAPRALANSVVGAPLVRLFNDVRERRYFARDDECLRELSEAGVDFVFVADPPRRDECPFRNVVRVLPTALLRRPLYMTCRLARSLHRFDRLILQPTAERYFGQPVTSLVENGVRNCRTVDGYRALLSEHAFANALDVAAFVLRDGTVIDVATEHDGTGARAEFVREVTARACTVFQTVLGPGFDERHQAHLHLDMGLLGGCRP
jgi:hypothetical protein